MKKSELKKIIREVIVELKSTYHEPQDSISVAQECVPCGCDDKTDPHQVDELGGQISGLKNRVMEGLYSEHSSEMFSIRGIEDSNIDVEVEYDFNKRSGRPDDPSTAKIHSITTEGDYFDADVNDASPQEIKVIRAIQLAVKSLIPAIEHGVLIPKGMDILVLNKKMNNYLQTDIDDIEAKLLEKHLKY